jgi:DNA-binding transcriptional ArsR family regulator
VEIRFEGIHYDNYLGLTKVGDPTMLNLMVNYSITSLDATFAALAHPTRRAILERLVSGESSVLELARPFAMSLPAITKHLKVLEEAGLVTSRKSGRVRRCRLAAAPMKAAAEWLSFYRRFWETRLDSLGAYLDETENVAKELDGDSHT